MKAVLAGLALLALTGQAQALSCMAPDPALDFVTAQESADIWIVVEGTVTFDPSALPSGDLTRQDKPPRTDIAARISGKSLGPTGFNTPYEADITLRVSCFGPWCGGAKSGMRYMAFLQAEGQGYVMQASPCGGLSYGNPAPDVLAKVVSCFQGKDCTPARPSR